MNEFFPRSSSPSSGPSPGYCRSIPVSVSSAYCTLSSHSRYAPDRSNRDVSSTPLSIPANLELLNKQRALRPSSPHFTIYQPQLTWLSSIANRVTGSGLSVGQYIPPFSLVNFNLPLHLQECTLSSLDTCYFPPSEFPSIRLPSSPSLRNYPLGPRFPLNLSSPSPPLSTLSTVFVISLGTWVIVSRTSPTLSARRKGS